MEIYIFMYEHMIKLTRHARIGHIKTVGQVGQVGHETVKRNKINGYTVYKNGPLV